MPSGKEFLSNHMLRNVELLLQWRLLNNDLIVLPMPEFDLIMEIDWSTKNRATIRFEVEDGDSQTTLGSEVCF